MPSPLAYIDSLEFLYDRTTGLIYLCDIEDGRALIGRGYAGKGVSRDTPDDEWKRAEGPLPRGMWRIHPAISHARLGPYSLPLTQTEGETFGRTGFYIHGDNAKGDGSASSGCIILPRSVREFISGSGIRTLAVV